MRSYTPNPNASPPYASTRYVLMDLNFLLKWTEPESEADDWSFLRISPGRRILSYGVLDRATRSREMTFCTSGTLTKKVQDLFADESPAVTELLIVADLDGPVGRRWPEILENDLFWPLLYWQLQQAYKSMPSEHKQYLDRVHGDGERFFGCNGWMVWPLDRIRTEYPWLQSASVKDLREVWLREIEARVLYLKRSDYARFWRLRYTATLPLRSALKIEMDAFWQYGLRAKINDRNHYIGWQDAGEAAAANDRDIITALTYLRCLVAIPLEPFRFEEPGPGPEPKKRPRELPPSHEVERAPATREIEAILKTPAGRLSAVEIAEAQRHFGLPEEPPPRYHPEKPPMLPKYIRLFREAHPGLEMRAGWQERLKDLRRDAARAGAYEGLHYNARERKHPYAVQPPRVGSIQVRGVRPGITRDLRQRLQPMLDEITWLRQAVLLAYEEAEATRRKKDYEKAVELDGRLDALEADVDDALEQLGSERDPLEPGPKNVFGDVVAEGDEPMGFREGPERELAVLYHDWLVAQKDPRQSQRFAGEEATDAALAQMVRQVLIPHGALREGLTDAELLEAARDAYEAETGRRARQRR